MVIAPRSRQFLSVIGAGAAGGVLLLAGLVRCPVATVLRIPCPGCGLTRATLRLFHGDLAGALAFHPLVLLVLPMLGFYAIGNAAGFLVSGQWGWVDRRMGARSEVVVWAFLALLLGVWISRFFGAFGGPAPV
jgi:hypothetical protein